MSIIQILLQNHPWDQLCCADNEGKWPSDYLPAESREQFELLLRQITPENPETLEQLLGRMVLHPDQPILDACVSGNVNLLRELVGDDMRVVRLQINGETALRSACRSGDASVVNFLLSCDPESQVLPVLPGSEPPKSDGKDTPLMIACRRGDIEIINLLLAWRTKEQLFHQNGQSHTALLIACEQGRAEVVESLLNWCRQVDGQQVVALCSVRTQDTQSTPLHAACRKGSLRSVELLLECDPSLVYLLDCYNRTPLYDACASRSPFAVYIVQRLVAWFPDIVTHIDYEEEMAIFMAC